MFKYELDIKTAYDLPEFATCMITVQSLGPALVFVYYFIERHFLLWNNRPKTGETAFVHLLNHIHLNRIVCERGGERRITPTYTTSIFWLPMFSVLC